MVFGGDLASRVNCVVEVRGVSNDLSLCLFGTVESLCVLFHFLLQNCFWIDVNAINKYAKHITDYLTSQIIIHVCNC